MGVDNLWITSYLILCQPLPRGFFLRYNERMKKFLSNVAAQATAIFLAATGAALIAFFQSAAVQTGVCEVATMSPQEAGGLGALFKSVHSALAMRHGMM